MGSDAAKAPAPDEYKPEALTLAQAPAQSLKKF
jgi:hypothetical protein